MDKGEGGWWGFENGVQHFLAKKIRKAVLEKYANEFCHHFDYKLWVCDTKSNLKMQ